MKKSIKAFTGITSLTNQDLQRTRSGEDSGTGGAGGGGGGGTPPPID